MPLDRSKLELVGRPSIRRLIDGRRQITRRWKLTADAATAANLETETFLALGTADFEFTDAVLAHEPSVAPLTEGGVEMALTEVYEEVSTPTNESEFNDAEVDEPRISTDADGRRTVTRQFIVRNTTSDALKFGTVGVMKDPQTSRFPNHYLHTQQVDEGEVLTRISRTYVQVTSSPIQVGDDDVATGQDARSTLRRRFLILKSAAYSAPTVGASGESVTVDGKTFVYAGERRSGDSTIRRITRRYVEATDTPVQIGKDRKRTDSNDRESVSQLWVLRAGATYTPLAIGSPYNTKFALTSESERADETVRYIRRRYIEADGTVTQIGGDDITRDADGRRSLQRQFIQLESAAYTPPAPGDPADVGSAFAFTNERESNDAAIRQISRQYIEANATPALVGKPNYSRGQDDRKQINQTLVKLATATEPAELSGRIGVIELEGCVLAQVRAQQNAAICRIYETYVEATDTAIEIGKADVRHIPRTFSPATGLGAAGARQWTHRFLVKAGSGDISDNHWLDYNAAGPLGAHQKLVNQQISHRGKTFAVISRVFVEVPAQWTETRRTRYLFPGSYYLSGSGGSPDPTTRVEPVRRWITATITETYSTTEPTPTAVFEVIRWLSTRLELPGQAPQLRTYRGYLGSVAWTGDYEESGSSNPSTYPSGATVIESDVQLWQGRIWKKRDVSITF